MSAAHFLHFLFNDHRSRYSFHSCLLLSRGYYVVICDSKGIRVFDVCVFAMAHSEWSIVPLRRDTYSYICSNVTFTRAQGTRFAHWIVKTEKKRNENMKRQWKRVELTERTADVQTNHSPFNEFLWAASCSSFHTDTHSMRVVARTLRVYYASNECVCSMCIVQFEYKTRKCATAFTCARRFVSFQHMSAVCARVCASVFCYLNARSTNTH